MAKQLMFRIKDRLGDVVFGIEEKSPKRVYISVHKSDLRRAAGVFFEDFGARFLTASGTDNGKNFEILYHFSFDNLGKIISIRTFIEKKSSAVDSIVPAVGPSAEWIEREMHELLGIDFIGHPDLRPLLLTEDSAAMDKYPYKMRILNEGFSRTGNF